MLTTITAQVRQKITSVLNSLPLLSFSNTAGAASSAATASEQLSARNRKEQKEKGGWFMWASVAHPERPNEPSMMPPPSQRGALPSPIRTTIHHDPETNRLHLGYITTERYRAPQNPVVLCHGLFGFDVLGPEFMPALQIHYWTGIAKALQDIGCKVHISRVGTVAALKTRAQELRTFLERKVEGQQVNLVAHSMGGLDCRYVITHLPSSKFQVNSLTTVATPHRGSSFMDWCRDAFGVGLLHDYVNKQGDDVVAKYLQAHDGAPSSKEEGKAMARKKQSRMVKANPIVSALCSPLDSPAFANLTRDYCEAFNRVTPDDPNVQYYSYAAVTDVHPLAPLYFSYRIIAEREGANDGLVSLESAKWGTFLGEVQCDHWQLIPPRLRSLVRAGGRGGFDSIGFYLGLVTGLADKGY